MSPFALLTSTTRTLTRVVRGGTGILTDVVGGLVRHVGSSPPRSEDTAPRTPTASIPTTRREPASSARGGSSASARLAAPPLNPLTPPSTPQVASPAAAAARQADAEATDDAPDQPEFESPHLDEEPAEVVYSSADPGAEDGAGASLRIEAPWPGYGAMSAADVIDRLTVADAAMLAAVQLFESTHKERPSILKAVELRLDAAARA